MGKRRKKKKKKRKKKRIKRMAKSSEVNFVNGAVANTKEEDGGIPPQTTSRCKSGAWGEAVLRETPKFGDVGRVDTSLQTDRAVFNVPPVIRKEMTLGRPASKTRLRSALQGRRRSPRRCAKSSLIRQTTSIASPKHNSSEEEDVIPIVTPADCEAQLRAAAIAVTTISTVNPTKSRVKMARDGLVRAASERAPLVPTSISHTCLQVINPSMRQKAIDRTLPPGVPSKDVIIIYGAASFSSTAKARAPSLNIQQAIPADASSS
ncbi:hypothetical protein BDK51DRAFT_36734 [Blyttiomyces helicus]|uniref:Uncharacterized protein n=1 Tax=Blyttiomyces helicus TaxID=388810 RepID=A0A4P9W8F0_9FUNG|nr:hypothetical protein BDK51DRAFT_36734 [Blyttiomyces helicus]|eukprot:RKO87725.1 hypothetical protein BDK51DRAFT_36734 [Blyttiomyces helicus]